MEGKLLENYMNFLPIPYFPLLLGMCKHYKLFILPQKFLVTTVVIEEPLVVF